MLSILLDLIRTDVLCDATGLTRNNARIPDCIKQRSFTVVNVSHHSNDRWTCLKVFRRIFDLSDDIFHIRIGNTNHFVAKFFDDEFGSIRINRLGLRRHDAVRHQRLHNICNALGHTVCEFRYHDNFGELYVAYNLFALNCAAHSFLALAFLLTLHRRH